MSEDRARWLARSFDLIGISCDGPFEIQTAQRPSRNPKINTLPIIERTARILHEAGKPVHVRVTLTTSTVSQQPEICQYLCENLKPQEMHVEPVYSNGSGYADIFLKDEHVDLFVEAYFKAQAIAITHGSEWKMSGSRINEVHGGHCNILRQVLNLVPGDTATACFKLANTEKARRADLSIGLFDSAARIFVLDDRHIRFLRNGYTRPSACEYCLIAYQCTHNCPNACPLVKQATDQTPGSDILCKILRKTASQQIISLGRTLEVSSTHPVARLSLPLA
jgi:MoaA/NifB/PqqE/SkfB family radical SAM enzyme